MCAFSAAGCPAFSARLASTATSPARIMACAFWRDSARPRSTRRRSRRLRGDLGGISYLLGAGAATESEKLRRGEGPEIRRWIEGDWRGRRRAAIPRWPWWPIHWRFRGIEGGQTPRGKWLSAERYTYQRFCRERRRILQRRGCRR